MQTQACRRGHPRTPENTYPSGGCRPCQQLRDSGTATIDTRKPGDGRTCKLGHLVTGDNLRVVVSNGATRYVCITCYKMHQKNNALREMRNCYAAYGNRCKCCGETNELFLTLDHVNNDGHVDRKVGLGGLPMYRKARIAGYPDIYQLLCFNCNCGRARNGGTCPHEC